MWLCVVVVHHFTRRDVISIAISKVSSSHLIYFKLTLLYLISKKWTLNIKRMAKGEACWRAEELGMSRERGEERRGGDA